MGFPDAVEASQNEVPVDTPVGSTAFFGRLLGSLSPCPTSPGAMSVSPLETCAVLVRTVSSDGATVWARATDTPAPTAAIPVTAAAIALVENLLRESLLNLIMGGRLSAQGTFR